jgi:tetratricopeptide (TPR) repeat protein
MNRFRIDARVVPASFIRESMSQGSFVPKFLQRLSSLLLRQRRRFLLVLSLLVLLAASGAIAAPQVWAEYHLRIGRRALARSRFDEAIRHFDCCLRVRPRNGTVHLLAAQAARRQGDHDAAAEHLSACRDMPALHEGYMLEWALLQAELGDVDSVGDFLFERVVENDPDTGLILEGLAKGYLRIYRTPEALRCLHLWVEREPDCAQALFCRGRAWQSIRSNERALDDLRRAIALDPDYHDCRLALAVSLLQSERNDEAVDNLEYLRTKRPGAPEVLFRLAVGRMNLGQRDEARAILDELLEEHPRYPPALTVRGQLALRAGRLAEAEFWLRRAVDEAPYEREANFHLLTCLIKLKVPLEEENRQAGKLKRIEKALDRLTLLGDKMAKQPHEASLHYEIAIIMRTIGREELCCNWLLSALRWDSKYAPAHAALADYYERHGDSEKAAVHRQHASDTPKTDK